METDTVVVLVAVGLAIASTILLVARPRTANGWGRCYRCHRSWAHLEPHVTTYVETEYGGKSGCFPLCESCWQKLGTPEARLPFYRLLWQNWQAQCPGHYDEDTVWVQMEQAVKNGG